jgi:hypothetical protein
MAPAALAGRRHSRGVPRPAMARPPGEPRVSRSRPEGMRWRENEPIHGPGSLGRSEAQPRCASTCDGSPSRRASRKPKQARRDASARKRAHPCPRRAWPGVVAAKVRPAGQAVAPPGDRGRRWRGSMQSEARHDAESLPAALTLGSGRGCPYPDAGLWKQAQPWMAERSGHAVSAGLEGRSERPEAG